MQARGEDEKTVLCQRGKEREGGEGRKSRLIPQVLLQGSG